MKNRQILFKVAPERSHLPEIRFFQKRSSLGTARMRHGIFQAINSGMLREIFKITAWVITELPQLSYITRLSFVLIMKVSIKSPLCQDKRVTLVARGTIVLQESRFSFKRIMTLLQLLWKWAWLKEKVGSWGVWETQIKRGSNFTWWEEFGSKSMTCVLPLRLLKDPEFHPWLVLNFQTREQVSILWDKVLKKVQDHCSSWSHCQPTARNTLLW